MPIILSLRQIVPCVRPAKAKACLSNFDRHDCRLDVWYVVILSATGNDSRRGVNDRLQTIQIVVRWSNKKCSCSGQYSITMCFEIAFSKLLLSVNIPMTRACRSTLKHAYVSLAMRDRKDRSWSIRTPRFRTDVAGWMMAFPITSGLLSMRWSPMCGTSQELCFCWI